MDIFFNVDNQMYLAEEFHLIMSFFKSIHTNFARFSKILESNNHKRIEMIKNSSLNHFNICLLVNSKRDCRKKHFYLLFSCPKHFDFVYKMTWYWRIEKGPNRHFFQIYIKKIRNIVPVITHKMPKFIGLFEINWEWLRQ